MASLTFCVPWWDCTKRDGTDARFCFRSSGTIAGEGADRRALLAELGRCDGNGSILLSCEFLRKSLADEGRGRTFGEDGRRCAL